MVVTSDAPNDGPAHPPAPGGVGQLPVSDLGGALLIGGRPVLDGNLADFKALVGFVEQGDLIGCAINQLDNVANGPPVGTDGFQDEPLQDDATPQNRFMHSPINVGNIIFVYFPDSDGVITPVTEDDSWLGVGVNIANGDGDVFDTLNKLLSPPDLPANIMVPFDSDGNGDPCTLGLGADSRWFPQQPVLTYDESIEALNLTFKLCATGPGSLTNPEFEVSYLQRHQQNTSVTTFGLDPAQFSIFPPVDSTCESIRLRGLDGNTTFPDGLGNDDVEIIIDRIDSQVAALFPGDDYLSVTRYRLANLGMTLRSDATADLSNEDSMYTICRLDIPEIEVTKQVRCVGDGDDAWRDSAEATPGAELEFRIEVANAGNVPLAVTLDDTMEALAAAGLAIDQASLLATLFRPADGPGVAITPANAASFGLSATFFTPTPAGFLGGVIAGEPRFLGNLQETDTCSDPELVVLGDRVVLTFRGEVTAPSDFCANPPTSPDLRNSISAIGDPDIPAVPDGDEVHDNAGGDPDTPREKLNGGDDNVVTADVLCRTIDVLKEVRLLPDGAFVSGDTRLSIPASPGPIAVEYRYTVTNGGETEESVALTDDSLCSDASGVPDVMITSCPLCQSATPGQLETTIAAGGTFQTSCTITFDTLGALRAFLTLDNNNPECTSAPEQGDPDDCYRNCASASALATGTGDVCVGPDAETADSSVTICNRVCDIQVTARARCIIDSCAAPTQFGPFVDSATDPLSVAQGSCVQYEVEIQNAGENPICRLRLDDLLEGQPTDITMIANSATVLVGANSCPVPACFNTLGNPCEFNPASCPAFPGGQFQPGQTIKLRFNASIPANANPNPPDPNHVVLVDGASDCPAGGPAYSCSDSSNVELDVLGASLRCDGKQWAVQSDTDADCEPEGAFGAFTSSLNLTNVVFPAILQLRIQGTNTGQVPLQVIAQDTSLTNCVNTVDSVSFVANPPCELSTGKLVQPGASAQWLCQIRVDSAQAARAMDTCDGTLDGVYDNTASVNGTTVAGGTGICVQGTSVTGAPTCSAEIILPPLCELAVDKQVKCATDPDSAFAADADALPGTSQTYRLTLTNTGDTPIPKVCITDLLSCSSWLQANSVSATLGGADVNNCVAATFAASLLTGNRACYSFAACRPAAPWLAAGESLEIRFSVNVPANFNQMGSAQDCVNAATGEAFAENCAANPPNAGACAQDSAQASIDVLVPDLDCGKTVCVDLDNNGTCDVGPSNDIDLPPTTVFPLTLIYESRLTNSGETSTSQLRICDPELIGDSIAAGFVFGTCDYCDGACDGDPADACVDIASLAPGATSIARCQVQVLTREAWEAFSLTDTDGQEYCYRNGAGGQGTVSTAGICSSGANTPLTTPTCNASVCIPPPIPQGGCCLPNGQCLVVTRQNCQQAGGIYNGDGVLCMGDANNNGIDDLCEQPIPTVSEWGLLVMTLLLLVVAKLKFGRTAPATAPVRSRRR